MGFTAVDNVADELYDAYVVPVVAVCVIQLVPVPVDDSNCPAVPTSPDASDNVDSNLKSEESVVLPKFVIPFNVSYP